MEQNFRSKIKCDALNESKHGFDQSKLESYEANLKLCIEKIIETFGVLILCQPDGVIKRDKEYQNLIDTGLIPFSVTGQNFGGRKGLISTQDIELVDPVTHIKTSLLTFFDQLSEVIGGLGLDTGLYKILETYRKRQRVDTSGSSGEKGYGERKLGTFSGSQIFEDFNKHGESNFMTSGSLFGDNFGAKENLNPNIESILKQEFIDKFAATKNSGASSVDKLNFHKKVFRDNTKGVTPQRLGDCDESLDDYIAHENTIKAAEMKRPMEHFDNTSEFMSQTQRDLEYNICENLEGLSNFIIQSSESRDLTDMFKNSRRVQRG